MGSADDRLQEYRARLREYRARRDAARKQYESVGRELRGLDLMVQGLEAIVGAEIRIAGEAERDQIPEPAGEHRRAPRVGVLRKIKIIMAAEGRADVDRVLEMLAADADFEGRPPARTTVSNRLNELAKDGFLIRLRKGEYQLVPQGADENPAERRGPNPTVQLDGEKPPAESLIDSRPGHPDDNLEGAPGVGTGPGIRTRGPVGAAIGSIPTPSALSISSHAD